MKAFEYHEPKSVTDVTTMLAEWRSSARVLAGGTDLIIQMEQRSRTPQHVVNIMHIPELQGIRDDGSTIIVGAATSLRAIETSPLLRKVAPVLPESAATIGSIQIRNLATLGGNICNAAPSADTVPPMLVLDARVTLRGAKGERRLPLVEFFKGPGQTALEADELLTHIEIPRPPDGFRAIYYKQSPRYAMDIAIVGVAVGITRSNGSCEDAKISLGAVAPVPLRVPEAEAILRGNAPDPESVEKAAEIARDASRPITDVRGSADYRRAMVANLVHRGLNTLLGF